MVHISELSHNYVKKVEDVLEMGQKVTAKVIKIDDKGRIDLSIKAMQVKEVKPPVHREEDFEKKLTNFMKFSDEKNSRPEQQVQRSARNKETHGKQLIRQEIKLDTIQNNKSRKYPLRLFGVVLRKTIYLSCGNKQRETF